MKICNIVKFTNIQIVKNYNKLILQNHNPWFYKTLQSKTEKILIGHKLKRLRQSLSISQLDMARELEISASYLNLLENNQRPITVHLLFRIGQLYNIDFKEFSDDETGKITAELNEVFSEPIINSNDISKREIKNLAS